MNIKLHQSISTLIVSANGTGWIWEEEEKVVHWYQQQQIEDAPGGLELESNIFVALVAVSAS